MVIDLSKIDAQIRRLEELKRMMTDPEMVRLVAEAIATKETASSSPQSSLPQSSLAASSKKTRSPR
jgi:hypothetical protein